VRSMRERFCMANILIADDDPGICRVLTQLTEDMGHRAKAVHNLADTMEISQTWAVDLVFLDLEFPGENGMDILPGLLQAPSRPQVIIITGTGTLDAAEIAFKHGAWDYVRKPFVMHEVTLPLSRALQYREETRKNDEPLLLKRGGIIGESSPITACLQKVAGAAASGGSVLISGETGTGKELFARAIHANSPRSQEAFVVVDCAALPDNLVESTLFGHEKGAFTGASSKREGLVARAHGGTLFLDEIGELPLKMQAKLLRVLQEQRFLPVGARREVGSDFRLLAATNQNLAALESVGKFRLDLLHRINSLEIQLPPLRERGDDIKLIVLHLLGGRVERNAGSQLKGMSPEFLMCLKNYSWPGNVRELINVVGSALTEAGPDPTLHPIHLPVHLRTSSMEDTPSGWQIAATSGSTGVFGPALPTLKDFRSQMEREYLQELLMRAGGDRKKASDISGISQSRLYVLLKQYGLPAFGAQ
jgi:two-component system NtrC family response regulator